jgi:hypothetical protein
VLKATIAVSIAAAAVALVLGVYATITATTDHHQISDLRGQLVQAHTVLARAERVISAQQAKLNGGHRDLITCTDLNELINGYTGPNPNGYIGLNQYLTANGGGLTLPLPAHCYNQ